MTPNGPKLRPSRNSLTVSRIRPMLAEPAPEPFDSSDYIYDVNWGGVRAIVAFDGERVRLHGRNLFDLTPTFPELAGVRWQLRDPGTVLDGEIVALNDDGHPDASLLRPRFGLGGEGDLPPVTFQALDILQLGGKPLLSRPLSERKALLSRVLPPGDIVLPSGYIEADGVAFFRAAIQHRLPGIVAKEKASLYYPGRVSAEWRDIPVYARGHFVIAGYIAPSEGSEGLSGVVLGLPERSGTRVVGVARGRFEPEEGDALRRILQPLALDEAPLDAGVGATGSTRWCRPDLVADISYGGWTSTGLLRFPLFLTLRPDISPRDCLAPSRRRAVS